MIISRAGEPVAKLIRHSEGAAGRKGRLGFLRGSILVREDFDTIGEEAVADLLDGQVVRP